MLEGFLCSDSFLRVVYQAFLDKVFETWVNFFPRTFNKRRPVKILDTIVKSCGFVGNCEFVQNDSIRPHIDCLRNHSFRNNFRRLVPRSTHPKLHVGWILPLLDLVAKTKIDYLDLLLVVQQDVLKLKVLVDDALKVEVRNSLQDLISPGFKFNLVFNWFTLLHHSLQ